MFIVVHRRLKYYCYKDFIIICCYINLRRIWLIFVGCNLDQFHRLLSQAICMTGSDLNSSAKPWFVQQNTSKVVYQEFHDQVSQTAFKNIFCFWRVFRVFSVQSVFARFSRNNHATKYTRKKVITIYFL